MQRLVISGVTIALALACSTFGRHESYGINTSGHSIYRALWAGNLVQIEEERGASRVVYFIDVHPESDSDNFSISGISADSPQKWNVCTWSTYDFISNRDTCAEVRSPVAIARDTVLLDRAFAAVHQPRFIIQDS